MARAPQPPLAYLDTHVALWLHDGLLEQLSSAAREVIAGARLLLSPMVELELAYLRESGRLALDARRIIAGLEAALGMSRGAVPFADVVAAALKLTWTRDPFDRLIVGEAIAANAVLLTRDSLIRRHYKRAVW